MPKRKRTREKSKPSRNPLSSRRGHEIDNSISREHFRTQTLPVVILILVSLLVYANAWPNTLVWDDEVFSLGNRLSGISMTEIGHFFTDDVWAAIGEKTGIYRPLLLVSVVLDIQLFGDWVAGFHLVNIFLHALATIMVYGLVRYLLLLNEHQIPTSSYIALLAALVFAVHPIHTEVVNSVFNRSELLVTLGVVGGLKWFLQTVEKSPRQAWGVLSLIYLLVMLCRETGIVLPVITVVVLWIITPSNWRLRLRSCLPVLWLLIPLAIYLGMRAHALETPLTFNEMVSNAPSQTSERQGLPILGLYFDLGRILPAVTVWFDAIKLMLWPHPLMAFHDPSEMNEWFALVSQLTLLTFAVLKLVQKKPGLFLGLAFFYLSILPSSRIIGEFSTSPHLAERYLYMPSVGLTIVLAFGISWLVRRFSLKTVVVSILPILMILTPLTWARNTQWASTVLLAETDYRNGAQSALTLETLVTALFMKGEIARAGTLCDRHADTLRGSWHLAVNCGHVYARLKRYTKAERTLRNAMNGGEGESPAHFYLAISYLEQNRRLDATEQFELAIATKKEIFKKEYLEAEMLMRLYPKVPEKLLEARNHLEKALLLEPQFYYARQRLDEIDEILHSADKRNN
jgi:tetratricopeptide (TPR) repeat protein